MAKFIVLVIDSFGVGTMPDTETTRPQDKGANTCLHILQNKPQLALPNLEKLGIINCLEVLPRPNKMQPNPAACYGKALLEHEGGDTFMGHQEIMGTLPLPPLRMPFSEVIDDVEQALKNAGHHVERKEVDGLYYLWVDHAAAVGDNLEADLGQVYNITGNLTTLTFDQVQEIGLVVRHCVKVGRVIAFGGLLECSSSIQQAAETKQGRYIGINAPKSGAYAQGFQVVHLGYGVNSKTQVPAQLHEVNIPTVLIGKVADIVANPHGISYEKLVDSQTILDLTLKHIQQADDCFICTNIQETDLAGHAQDVELYSDRLHVVDHNLTAIMSALQQGDILIVMADHGNDPTIGHSKHTREKVPLLIYTPGILPAYLGERSTMADVGATVCDYFHATAPENGLSFLSLIHSHVHY